MILTPQSQVDIIIPRAATQREEFAAQELKKYLEKIFSGIQVSLSPVASYNPSILIGGPERNAATAAYITEAEFDALVPGPEGIFIKAFADALVIAGSSKNPNERERGTLYAVYEFLERFLGCSFSAFFNPDYAGGEYIPTLSRFDLTNIAYTKAKADNNFRTAEVEFHHRKVDHILNLAFIDWLAKNRYNRIVNWSYAFRQMKDTGMLEEAQKRGFLFTAGHHDGLPTYLPPHGNEFFPEHYYETHPEYYRLLEDGSRYEITNHWGAWPLCSRNPELPGVVAKNIIQWIDLHPMVDTLAFWPMDGKSEQCACPACRKYDKVTNYAYFENEVAKHIAAVRPELKIDMLSYAELSQCPDGIELEPNLFVSKATWNEVGLRAIGKPDGSCLANTVFETDLMKWKETGCNVVYYDYFMGVHPARQRYIPAADELQSNWKRFMELGIDGSGTQIEYFNFWNHIFNFYCFARTGYDTSLSMEDNLAKFTVMFGEGASYVADVIRLAEATLDGQETIMTAGLYLMRHLDMEKVYSLLETALAAATTPAARNNIRLFRMELRYSDLETKVTNMVDDTNYKVLEVCPDPTGELYYMSHNFDSGKWQYPGFGIMFPLDCAKEADFQPDHWYEFETV